jgi:hypothetical protein
LNKQRFIFSVTLLMSGACLGIQLTGIGQQPFTQPTARRYKPVIEPCACPIKTEITFKSRCGYLIVPENRDKATGNLVRLPFIIVESNNPHKKKDPVLFTSGGPGNSSLGSALGVTKSTLLRDRDFIAFEQPWPISMIR